MIRTCMLFLMLWCGCLLAQDAGRQRFLDTAALRYLRIANTQSPLYYGNEYEGQQRATNHPFLINPSFTKTRLSYHQVVYPEAQLRLDLSKDALIVFSPDFRQLVLFPENVDFAELHGKHIIYFRSDTLRGSPSSGYYIQLHSGICKVLEKNTATLLHQSEGNRLRYYYTFTTRYFLLKDGVYYNIRNRRGLLKALSPYKKELKRFISDNNLFFRKNAEELLVRTVDQYEKLSESL